MSPPVEDSAMEIVSPLSLRSAPTLLASVWSGGAIGTFPLGSGLSMLVEWGCYRLLAVECHVGLGLGSADTLYCCS